MSIYLFVKRESEWGEVYLYGGFFEELYVHVVRLDPVGPKLGVKIGYSN